MNHKGKFLASGALVLSFTIEGASMLGFLAKEVPTPIGVILFFALAPTGETIRLLTELIKQRKPSNKEGGNEGQ